MRPPPQPVQPIAALLYRDEETLNRGLEALERAMNLRVDRRGAPHPFTYTDYYGPEMGEGLNRVLVSLLPLADPVFLAEGRWQAHEVEQAFSLSGQRTVNIDLGYLDLFKVVLASFKERGNKIYLGRGVWADMTLTFERGGFHPLPWSFPDFKAGVYNGELLEIRTRYKALLADETHRTGQEHQ